MLASVKERKCVLSRRLPEGEVFPAQLSHPLPGGGRCSRLATGQSAAAIDGLRVEVGLTPPPSTHVYLIS
jgi:hypothetical protein